jgi:hypothetical protein
MQVWFLGQIFITVLLSACSINGAIDSKWVFSQKSPRPPKCSNRFCVDLECVPRSCPRMIKNKDPEASSLKNKFAALINFLNANEDFLTSPCNINTAIQSLSTVTVCVPDNMSSPASTQPFDAALAIQSTTAIRSPIPSGAIIYSSNIVVINGFFWNQVIFFYQGQFCYVSYNTGIRSIVSLKLTANNSVEATAIKSGAIQPATRDLKDLENKILNEGFGEGMVASDLTTILKCVPGALQFNQVRCLSSEILPVLLLNS